MNANSLNNPKVVEQLNHLLADLQIVYQNLRTSHWLVKGPEFFNLHKLFEEYYNETAEVIDEVAERVLMLGGIPLHTYNQYVTHAQVAPLTEVAHGRASIQAVTDQYSYLLKNYRNIIKTASSSEDEGTVALMSELIASTEKKLWMLNSTLK